MTLRDHRGTLITPPMVGGTRYEYDWFSGSQISLMIGDVVIDNAVSISFDVSQSKTPVFGYASQYYTFVSDGKVLVQGSLVIGFKEAGYLLWPIKRYSDLNQIDQWTSPRYSVENGQVVRGYDPSEGDNPFQFRSAADAAHRKKVMEANVEQMTNWSGEGSGYRDSLDHNRFWRELGALPDNKFEAWAEVFEDVLWYGSDPKNAAMRDKLFSGNIRPDGIIDEETVLSHRRADQYPQTDIWIVYGDISRPAANHTVKKLLDVSFLGQSQVIEVSGEPIYETYQFIAKNHV